MTALTDRLRGIVGSSHVITDPDVLDARSVDWTGRYRGRAAVLVRPGTAGEVAAVLSTCREAQTYVTVQGGRTSLVAGTVPEHDDVLLSTERLTDIGAVDATERTIHAGAGVTLAAVQRAAAEARLLFGVDLSARDSATIGGMASTNAGGLRTVRYGSMGDQVLGIEVALPDGSVLQRHSAVRSDNTGYDLVSLFVGAEGTLGVITGLDLRLHPIPQHRATAICAFTDLNDLLDTVRRFRDLKEIAALELIDARAVRLAAEHLNQQAAMAGDWLLLIELASDTDPVGLLAGLPGEPAVGVDRADQQRLWQVRESVAEVVGLFGPPLKFDVSLPLSAIPDFARHAEALITRYAPEALPVLFGHAGEGNLHLNVLRCSAEEETQIYSAMMELIASHGGNVSSEHGVGTLKRHYVGMSRNTGDIAVMRSVKAALDPTGFLNPAVLFD